MTVQTDDIEDINEDLATAVGLYVLSDATLHEAATEAGITGWELEDALVDAGLAETFGIEQDTDLTEEIDRLLDEGG